MEQIKKENKIIISLGGDDIPQDFFEIYPFESEKIVQAGDFFRLEHPHCAFFNSTQNSNEGEFLRKTLYTPQGRLHMDDKEGEVDKYVKKKESLEILLFYLRDVEIKPAVFEVNENVGAIYMPKTPLIEFLSFVEEKLFHTVMDEYEMEEKHIMSQFRRIYNEKFDILCSKLSGKIKYAVFNDVDGIDLEDEVVDRWHLYYVRKTRLLK